MAQRVMEQRVENLEHRVATVEQILPTLATKADLDAAIAPLATRVEVKADIKAASEQTRRHFDVVAEGLRAEIRLIAEGQTATHKSIDATRTDIMRVLEQHDRRLLRLEAPPKRRSPA